MKQCWKSNTENTQLTDSETSKWQQRQTSKNTVGKRLWRWKSATLAAGTAITGKKLHQKGWRLQHRAFMEHESSSKTPLTADSNTQVDQTEEAALLQDSVWARCGSAAVRDEIPWTCQTAAVLWGGNHHPGNSSSSLSSCNIQEPSTELQGNNLALACMWSSYLCSSEIPSVSTAGQRASCLTGVLCTPQILQLPHAPQRDWQPGSTLSLQYKLCHQSHGEFTNTTLIKAQYSCAEQILQQVGTIYTQTGTEIKLESKIEIKQNKTKKYIKLNIFLTKGC